MPHQGTSFQEKTDCPWIGNGGFGRALRVALECPKESAGHNLSVQAALASIGGSSSHWWWAGDSWAGEAASSGVFLWCPYHLAWQFHIECWYPVPLETTFILQNKSKFHRVRWKPVMALLSPSLFCWLHKTTLFRKLVVCEAGTLVFQITILLGSVCQVLLRIRDGGRWGKKVKSYKCLLEWQTSGKGLCKFLPSAIHRQTGFWTKVLQLTSQAEGRDSLRQAIMCDCNNQSGQRNRSSTEESKLTLSFYNGTNQGFGIKPKWGPWYPPLKMESLIIIGDGSCEDERNGCATLWSVLSSLGGIYHIME